MLTTVTFLGINSILISVGNNRGHLRLSTSDAAYKQEVVNTYQGDQLEISISTPRKTKFCVVGTTIWCLCGSVENQDPQETCAVHYKLSGMLS